MSEATVRDVVVNGTRSTIRSCAPKGHTEDREAVVFVHGNPGSSEDWVDFLPQVGSFARAIAPDMPGYGKADRPKDFDYTVEGFGKHLALILAELGVERVHLVLHDFGGAWGLQFASDHPERVASLTLINVGALPGYRWHWLARIWRTPLLGELFQVTATRSAFGMILNGPNPKPFPPEFIDRMFADSDWGMSRGMLKLYRATPDMGAVSVRLAESLKDRNLPALVLWGADDSYLPSTYADNQKDYFDAEVHSLADCGHWPMIDDPGRVSELLTPFLRTQCGSSRST